MITVLIIGTGIIASIGAIIILWKVLKALVHFCISFGKGFKQEIKKNNVEKDGLSK